MRLFAFRTFTFAFSMLLFAFGCGGSETGKREASNESSEDSTDFNVKSICLADGFSMKPHELSTDSFRHQTRRVISKIGYEENNLTIYKDFISTEINAASFIDRFCNSPKCEISCENGSFPGVIIYYGLEDKGNGGLEIVYFLGKVKLFDDNIDVDRMLEVNEAKDLMEDFTEPIYRIGKSGMVRRITTGRDQYNGIAKAYRNKIRIIDNEDNFQIPDFINTDTRYQVYPLEVITSYINSNNLRDKSFSITSSLLVKDDEFIHSTSLGTISPKKLDSLLKSEKTKEVEEAIKSFASVYGNFSQLCPTKCGRLDYKIVTEDGKQRIELIEK